MIENSVIGSFAQFNCIAKYRSDVQFDWDYVYQRLNFREVYGSDQFIKYQELYLNQTAWHDHSVVIYKKNGEPCGIFNLHSIERDQNYIFTSAGLPIEPIQFLEEVSHKERKRLIKGILLGLIKYTSLNNFDQFQCHAYFDCNSGSVGPWHEICAELAISSTFRHQVFLDLTSSIEQIKAGFRKSYKPLIGRAEKLWDASILTFSVITDEDWAEFKSLHFSAAGNRQTRSDESWAEQYKQILEEKAFLVTIKTTENNLIGGGYFQHTANQCIYSVGAYDRALFEYPIGHLVQWLAINKMKQLGIQSYIIGDRPYPSNLHNPTPKELSIGMFKEGFSNTKRVQFIFQLPNDYKQQ